MPVVDLAEYLGMPAQAPQQPLFQSTQRMTPVVSQADAIWQNTQAFNNLSNLQRLAPVYQAQQAQLAYDTVAQKARDLRMQQEIQAQAENAVNELVGAGVTPESADYSTRLRELVTKNPLAVRDPGFQQIIGLYEDQNRAFQQSQQGRLEAEAAYQKAFNEDVISALEAGLDPRLARGAKSREELAHLKSQLPKAGRTGVDQDERRLRTQADIAEKRFRAISDSVTATDEQIAEAEQAYMSALDNWSKYSPGQAAVQTTQPATPTVRPPMAAAANAATKTFIPAPTPDIPPAPVEKDEDYYVTAIVDAPDAQTKTKLLEEFKDFAKSPVARTGETVGQAMQRKRDIEDKMRIAMDEVEAIPELKKYSDAWSASKRGISDAISRFAKSIGMSPENVENSLISGEFIKVPGMNADEPMSMRRILSDFLAETPEWGVQKPDYWQQKDPDLSSFANSKFATRLGLGGILGTGIGSRISRGDVLDEYLKEKKAAQPVKAVPGMKEISQDESKIKSNLLKGVGLNGNG